MIAAASVVIRPAAGADVGAMHRLAALDSAACPPGPVLLAEVDGEIRAALALAGGATVADPFRPTAELVALLRLRAAQLAPPRPAPGRRRFAGIGEWRPKPQAVATRTA